MKTSIISHYTNKFSIIISLVFIFLVWQVSSFFFLEVILPSPLQTFMAIEKMMISGELLSHLKLTLIRVFLGFSLGTLSAVFFGVFAGKFSMIYELFRPIQAILIGSPPIAIVVLAMIWFSTGHIATIFVISILVFPTVFIHTADGYRQLDRHLFEMANVYQRPLRTILLNIVIPGLLSPIFTSISLAIGSAFRIGIMAELLNTSNGIGYSIAIARANLDTAKVFAWIFISIIIVILIDFFITRPLKNRVSKWRF